MKKKICIIGHARHGKDTVAEMINERYGYTSESSSQAASRLFLYDELKNKYGYNSPEECFEDRVNHRAEWFDMICEYNKKYPGQLAADIMKSNDIYTGMRSNRELHACINDGIFNLVIGVFDPMKPLEPRDSFDIDIWYMSDIIIPNAGSLASLRYKVELLKELLEHK
jgi:hypothetical protein